MLADDPLGAKRERLETPLPEGYLRAFAEIDADANNELVVACLDSDKGAVVGVLQVDGKMVDAPHLKQAQHILSLAD